MRVAETVVERAPAPLPYDVSTAAAELVARSRAGRGLPAMVEDESALARVATIVCASLARTRQAASR